MERFYSLRDDLASIRAMQRASLSEDAVGLRVTHSLIGSNDWWSEIEKGKLTLHSIHGRVHRFWLGQHGDGPAEFELREKSGATSSWMCEIEPKAAKDVFRIGREVEVQFVIQELKMALGDSYESKITVAILLG
jgi:hypothetical protein